MHSPQLRAIEIERICTSNVSCGSGKVMSGATGEKLASAQTPYEYVIVYVQSIRTMNVIFALRAPRDVRRLTASRVPWQVGRTCTTFSPVKLQMMTGLSQPHGQGD